MAFTERYVTQGAAGGGSGTSGSPWTFAEAVSNHVAGDRINVKDDGVDYAIAAVTLSVSSTSTGLIHWRGYSTTIGDGGKPTLANTGVFSMTCLGVTFESFSFTPSVEFVYPFQSSGGNFIYDVDLSNSELNAGGGLSFQNGDVAFRCRSTMLNSVDTAASAINARNSSIRGCTVKTNRIGISAYEDWGSASVQSCVVVGTGPASVGIAQVGNVGNGGYNYAVAGNSVYGFVTGIALTANTPATNRGTANCVNNVVYNVGTGILLAGTVRNGLSLASNFIGLASTARYSGTGDTPVIDDVILTADPFTDSAGDDFTLNNTAGGGALVRDAGLEAPDPL